MTDFDFGHAVEADAEAWHPALQEVLPKGNYVLKVTELSNETSSGGYPMLKLTLESETGRQWDNVVISPNEFSVAKLLGLIESAGLHRPDPETGEIDRESGRLSDEYVNQLFGKTVGVLVRDEEDNREDHRGEFRPRVKGYVDPKLIPVSGPLGGSGPVSNGPAGPAQGDSPLAF